MKLTTAKDVLQLNIRKAGKQMPPDTLAALKLGIEAIENLITQRADWLTRVYKPLPGETKE